MSISNLIWFDSWIWYLYVLEFELAKTYLTGKTVKNSLAATTYKMLNTEQQAGTLPDDLKMKIVLALSHFLHKLG